MTPPPSPLSALLVSYAFPRPGSGRGSLVGGERMRQFAKYLPEHGITPVVLTHGGLKQPQLGPEIHSVADLARVFGELIGVRRVVGASASSESRAGKVDRLDAWRARVEPWIFPDLPSYSWAPLAVARGLALIRKSNAALIVSSSPPVANHAVALTLKRSTGLPWIADFRDGYSFEPPDGPPHQLLLRRAFEREILREADRSIGVTDPISVALQALQPEQADKVLTLRNGFDPDVVPSASTLPARRPDGSLRILYAGSAAAFTTGQSLSSLLSGFELLAHAPATPAVLQLAGAFADDELQGYLGDRRIERNGWLSRPQVLRAMLDADVLVVLSSTRASVATSKLFDYIGAGRPILVVGSHSEAARIVRDSGFGLVCDDEPQQIAQALRRLAAEREQWQARLASPELARARAQHSRRTQAGELARVIREVIATHSSA